MIKIEELVYNYIHTFCDFEKQLILTNHFHTDWEADLLLVDEHGVSHEIEIKFSKSDFKNDFKKSYRNNTTGENFLKHEKLKCGDYICNQFSFLLPMGMIEPKEIPDHCGIIEFYHNPDSWETSFYEIRKPTKIHETSYWDLVDKDLFTRKITHQLLAKKFEMKAKKEEFIFKYPFEINQKK